MTRRLLLALALLAALAPPASAQQTTEPTRRGTAENFELVGAHTLFSRGMNAAPAIYHNYMYVGNRTDASAGHVHPGILVLDVSRPGRPRVVNEISPPDAGGVGQTTRELRVWPQAQLLIVMQFRCSTVIHACPPSPPDWSLRFYDLSGANAAQPRLLTTFKPSRQPHEMYLWLDPDRPGRALLYLSTPTTSTTPTTPNLIVLDVSQARSGVVREIATGNWNHLFPGTELPSYRPPACDPYDCNLALHSMFVSADGTRTHLAYLSGHYLILDTSELANADVPPGTVVSLNDRLVTPPANRPTWPNPNPGHSAVPFPGRPYALVTDEVYGRFTQSNFGCPWGWARTISTTDPARPVVVGEYRLFENTPAFCGSPLDDIATEDYTSYAAHNPTLTRNLALVSWHSGGLQAFSIANPAAMPQTGFFSPAPLPFVGTEDPALGLGPNKVIVWSFPIVKNGLVYVVDIRNGVYVVRYTGRHAGEVEREIFLEGNSNLTESCPVATARPRTARVGRRTAVTVNVELFEQRVWNALVTLRGAGVVRRAWTGVNGAVRLPVRPTRPGRIAVRVPNVAKRCLVSLRAFGRAAAPRPRPPGERLTGSQ